jgi:hypothetical protein
MGAPRQHRQPAPASQSGHLREPSLALSRPWSPTGFGSRQVTVLYRCGEGRTFRTVPPAHDD